MMRVRFSSIKQFRTIIKRMMIDSTKIAMAEYSSSNTIIFLQKRERKTINRATKQKAYIPIKLLKA